MTEQLVLVKPPIHALIHGETGSGKSTFAATFPKPMLVILFDSFGKHLPYVKAGKAGERVTYNIGDQVEIPYQDIQCDDGIIRVEFYHDMDIDNPTSFRYYRTRMAALQNEMDDWKTLITDSVTYMELSARKLEEKVMNPLPPGASRYGKGGGHDARTWYGGATDALEEMLCVRYAGLPMNVVVICHTNKKKDVRGGEFLQGGWVPGRLYERSLLASSFQEQYRCYTVGNEAGTRDHYIQTQNRDGFMATTQIDAPDPSHPYYKDLWHNWGK